MNTVFVTGGAGFIGSNLVRYLLKNTGDRIVNIDKLTYAGNLFSLRDIAEHPRYVFEKVDICHDRELKRLFETYTPIALYHLAAESHVDRSIDAPDQFIQTNIVGTYQLLSAMMKYQKGAENKIARQFKMLHVSTDEVFGSLDRHGFFTETTPYDPRSPYSASKAASDHLVRAWHHTYGTPVVITNCSNNYGPFQFPEKLIPVVILKALNEQPIPVYGKGENIRDWLYVEDHVKALHLVMERGSPGKTYVIGGRNEKTNIALVNEICKMLDQLQPRKNSGSYCDLIKFVEDRPGHDKRYAIDPSKIEKELGYTPATTFSAGMRKTVEWYLNNQEWCDQIVSKKYSLERLGLNQ